MLNMQKHGIFLFLLLILSISAVHGQEIITADRYMEMVSEQYSHIKDYEANIVIRSGNTDMVGNVSHRSPSFLRIDFSRPAEQVILFDGEWLTVYLPEYRAVLCQNINQAGQAGGRKPATTTGPAMASAQGLILLRRNYVPSFVTGPNPEPLEANSREKVVKVKLTRRSISEGFREIIVSIDPDTKLIRRIEGRSIADAEVRFDFTNIKTNQGIPEQRFLYDPPGSANLYYNFLFRDSD